VGAGLRLVPEAGAEGGRSGAPIEDARGGPLTIKQLKEWADKLPPDAKVELMLQEVAKANGYNLYKTPEHGGWVEVQGEHLRVTMEHPERRPAQVAEKLLK